MLAKPSLAPSQTALVVLGAQHDPPPEGALRNAVSLLVRAARAQGRALVWATASFGEPSSGPREWTIEPRGASPFADGALLDKLIAAHVSRLVLCGAATHPGVLHFAAEAMALGYELEVAHDALPPRSARALRELVTLGVRVRRVGELLAEGEGAWVLEGLGAGGSALWCDALGELCDFDALAGEVGWSTMYHRGGEVPRRVALQGSRFADGVEPLYRHPIDGQPALSDWTPRVDALRRAVEARVGHPLNHCLLQLYRDGHDWIGEHSDKTLDLVRGSPIVNVSLGRMRTMLLRPKSRDEDAAVQKLPLPHGSFLVMDAPTNRAFYHAIKPEVAGEPGGPRVSLTFRSIGTWVHPASGAVWGVGAVAPERAQAEARALAHRALPPEQREALEREEAERMLRLFRDENVDPAFDADAYRPGFEVLDLGRLNEPR